MRVNGSKSRVLLALMAMLTFGLGRVLSGGIDSADHAHHDHSEDGIHVEDGGTLTRGLADDANSDTVLLNDDEDVEFVRDDSWIELTQAYIYTLGSTLPSGTSSSPNKYYLSTDVTLPGGLAISANGYVVLDLNGYTVTGSGATVVFSLGSGSQMTIQDNSADGTGTITNGASTNGGGIYLSAATLIMEGGTITGNRATGATDSSGTISGFGGGVFATNGSTVIIYDAVISENEADVGAGIAIVENSSFFQYGGTISNNTADIKGGGLHLQSSSGTIYDATYSNNVAGTTSSRIYNTNDFREVKGGAICLWGYSALSVYGGEYRDNSVLAASASGSSDGGVASGGAMYIGSYGSMVLYGGSIHGNTATWSGGAIENNNNASLYLYGGEIYNNTCTRASVAGSGNYSGGGLGVSGNSYLYVFGPVRIHDNYTTGFSYGANVFFRSNSNIEITNGYIQNAARQQSSSINISITGGYFGAENLSDSTSSSYIVPASAISSDYEVVELSSSDDAGDPYFDEDFPYAVYRTTEGHSVAETVTITYGDDIPLSTTYSGLMSEAVDTVSWTETSNTGASSGQTGSELPINAGTYDMDVTTKNMVLISGSAEDYSEVKDYYPSQELEFTLQINRATATADNFSYVEGSQYEFLYDGSAHYADIQFTGLQATDTIPDLEIVYSQTSASINRATPIDAGVYYIFVTGQQTNNYEAINSLNTGLTLTIYRSVADPENTPEAITSCADTLGEIDLSEYADENGYWSWAEPETVITEDGGVFQAIYNPYDELVQGVTADVTITSEHVRSSDYSYDETGHWRDCVICGEPQGFVVHTFSSWEVTVEPTAPGTAGMGEESRFCRVCGYTETRDLDYWDWYEGGEQTPGEPEVDNTPGELAGMVIFLLGDVGSGGGLWWSLKHKRFWK